MELVGAGEGQQVTGPQTPTKKAMTEAARAARSRGKKRRAPAMAPGESDLLSQSIASGIEVEEACYNVAASSSRLRHSPLVIFSIAILAMAMWQPAFAALSCEVRMTWDIRLLLSTKVLA